MNIPTQKQVFSAVQKLFSYGQRIGSIDVGLREDDYSEHGTLTPNARRWSHESDLATLEPLAQALRTLRVNHPTDLFITFDLYVYGTDENETLLGNVYLAYESDVRTWGVFDLSTNSVQTLDLGA